MRTVTALASPPRLPATPEPAGVLACECPSIFGRSILLSRKVKLHITRRLTYAANGPSADGEIDAEDGC